MRLAPCRLRTLTASPRFYLGIASVPCIHSGSAADPPLRYARRMTAGSYPHRRRCPAARSLTSSCRCLEMQTPVTRSMGHDSDANHALNGPETLQELCADLHHRIDKFLGLESSDGLLKQVQEQTRVSLNVTLEALQRYGLEQLSLSYNGGKDCLVLLVIYLAAIHIHYEQTPSAAHRDERASNLPRFPEKLRSIHIQPLNSFPEVDSFVRSSSLEYHLELTTSSLPMRDAFEEYLEQYPDVKAIFVGTRRTDPHGGSLTHFDHTDAWWPSFMRVHPVIDWHYREIWAFIRQMQIPYCSLYDMGYTSLGGTTDTFPNPKLRMPTESGDRTEGAPQYMPAHELLEDDEERLGRE